MKKYLFAIFTIFPCLVFCSKIAIVTVVIGSSYYEATSPGVLSKQDYCKQHGYDFICYTESLDPSRPHAWQKIKAVQDSLSSYDWIFWSDADSIIMDSNILLESLIDEKYSFIIAYDNFAKVVNSGQFLIKNSDWSYDFLENVYRREDCIYHPWWENAAIIKEIEASKSIGSFVKIIEQRRMNSFAFEVCGDCKECCYQNGDFIIHFPSIRDLSLLETLMRKYYSLAK